jgi:hypothetical protein
MRHTSWCIRGQFKKAIMLETAVKQQSACELLLGMLFALA